MGYYIYAWLDNATPQLQIVDAESGSICVNWKYQSTGKEVKANENEVKRLFRDLILLTCKQEMNNSRIFVAEPVHNSLTQSQCCI